MFVEVRHHPIFVLESRRTPLAYFFLGITNIFDGVSAVMYVNVGIARPLQKSPQAHATSAVT